ncbi:C1q-related factor-like [Scomber scombrus]|uniref:C1q-related factor-like n=1 Tax=Scomber scombrus TaxID=13677 RepID=A0AAV1PXY3_SCOSC
MATKMLLLLALFGLACAELPYERSCDRVQPRDTPTRCSNYKNTVFIYDQLKMLQKRTDGLEAAPKIAFSTSLSNSGFIYGGPSSVNLKLVFKRVISNIGNGYNPDTGIFTASVKGLYYFTFTTVGCKSYDIRAMLMKNGAHQVSTNDHRSTDSTDSSSNAAALPLDAGDKVHVQLSANSRVFDNRNGYTTFSGFLLFSM